MTNNARLACARVFRLASSFGILAILSLSAPFRLRVTDSVISPRDSELSKFSEQIWFGVRVVRGLYAIGWSQRESGWPQMIANSIHV